MQSTENKEMYKEEFFRAGSFLDKVESKIWRFSYKIRNDKRKKRIKNKDFSLFCSMCYGGFIYHELGQRFLSPTINLFIRQKDYLKMLSNLKYYMGLELKFEKGTSYPIAKLDDIEIHFNHYKSNAEAQNKWNERKSRINWDNLYAIMIEREGITYEDIIQFDKLEGFKNKVIFTCREYPEIESACFLKIYKNEREVLPILKHVPFTGLRVADKYFDYVEFLNQ